MALLVSFPLHSQSIIEPLNAPAKTDFPGVYESFEKVIQFDEIRYSAKLKEIISNKKTLSEIKDINTVDIDPDFMNSIILNSNSGYLKIASRDRCTFYSSLLADLLKTKEGKIENLFIQYQDKADQNITALMSKKDFLEKVIFASCPKTKETIDMFQVKVIGSTISKTDFVIPSNKEGCEATYLKWLEDPKTPFWCQIHDLFAEVESGELSSANLSFKDKRVVENKISIAKILKTKMSDSQQEFLRNFCTNADSQKLFCEEFFTTNFFAKVVEGTKSDLYIKDICSQALNKSNWSPVVIRECAQVLRKNQEACFWGSYEKSGLSPRPRCDHLSTALNFSSLIADFDDCPRFSDQQTLTSFARIIRHIERRPLAPVTGNCSAQSAGIFFEFNKKYSNEDIWKASVCYDDRVNYKETCLPMFFGIYDNKEYSITNALKEVLVKTRGAGRDIDCKIISDQVFNPKLLEFKYGCFIVTSDSNCGIGQCEHKIFFNEKELKDIKFQFGLPFEYFATNLMNEKYSQHYVLQKDAKQKTKAINTVTALKTFFKQNPKGIIQGVGCSEDLLPGFFKKYAFNQCTPLAFIVDGIVADGDRISLVTRSGADNIHAPRLISWSSVFSAVKTYQFHHPVRQWTFYGIY